MGKFSEQNYIVPDDPDPDHPPPPLSLSERAAKLGPTVSQAARSEHIRSISTSRPASPVQKAIIEPNGRSREADRSALLSVAGRVAAVAAVVAVVALLFIMIKPASRQLGAGSTASDITGSTSPSSEGGAESKAASTELKAPASQAAAHEEPDQLLQRFLRWHEKTNATEPSQ